jgi:hypothetical protein
MKKYAVLLALTVSLLLVQAAAAELVVNGGFETGDFTGWDYSATLDYAGVDEFPPDPPHSGIYYGYFGNYNTDDGTILMGFLSQIIPTTDGASYNVSFWLAYLEENLGDPLNQFQAKWGDDIIFAQTNIPGDDPVIYTQHQFTVNATGSSTVLEFGLSNVPSWIYLDDISVNQVPIPGAVWLLGSGLVGLAGLRRKFKS